MTETTTRRRNHLSAFVDRLVAAGLVDPPPNVRKVRRLPPGWGLRDSLEQKFDARVVRTDDGCWGWIGAVNEVNGYAYIGKMSAHRYSHERHIGPIPDGFEVDHGCRVRTCTNPAHLEAVTPRENKRRAKDTPTCRHGHPWTDASTHRTPDGRRNCRTCNALKSRRLRARRAAERRTAA